MFDFGNANDGQRAAISTVDGPVLITAGPGTGKTYTLVERAIYLIQERGVAPEQILMATFTEKAAKELVTRITNELSARGIAVNVNEMYIGTFHSICLRILKEHLEYTRLKKNYRTLDAFDQTYTVFRNMDRFRAVEESEQLLPTGGWKAAQKICRYVGSLMEEMVDPAALRNDSNPKIRVLGRILTVYGELLAEQNLIDFASLQTEAYRLLKNHPEILQELQDKIRYIMIDEYQDTNYIQEQIVFLLGGGHKNICVVGDDDQGLYRFRGATIRNILEFPGKFAKDECRIIPLNVNYRSNSDIVRFYNAWMDETQGKKYHFEWDRYRYRKHITPYAESTLKSSSVVKLSVRENEDEWHEKVYHFLERLRTAGALTNYNQVAFLFRSVKSDEAKRLAAYLEERGIHVYSPRSNMFFEREEIKIALGLLMRMFPQYPAALKAEEFTLLPKEVADYYRACLAEANRVLADPQNAALRTWIDQRAGQHADLSGTTDYAYSGLFYQMLAYEPFRSILTTDMGAGLVDVRPSRNLAQLSQMIGKYEYLHNIDVLSGKNLETETEIFFNLYLRLLFSEGINEYEDDAEYAPSGCVSFLTVHQSKGMEFPVVFVASLKSAPRKTSDDLLAEVESRYFSRPAYEPYDEIKYFDFWRLYYTAFSRAQDLLVLSCNEDSKTPSSAFDTLYGPLEDADSDAFDAREFRFKDVKTVNLKESFSFTSHIAVYETCSLQYKFYKELGFAPVRAGAMVFGMLVHETIEDIHKAALRNESSTITGDHVAQWLDANYAAISTAEHSYLAEAQRDAALRQVLRYVDRHEGHWDTIRQAEVDVSLVMPTYIVEGKIDLVEGQGDTVDIVDFKSEKKPDPQKGDGYLERYRRQLHLYAHLVEERTGKKVNCMRLYYTGEEAGDPTIVFPYVKGEIDSTVKAFDGTVQKILRKQFAETAKDPNVCRNCDFRYYCRRK